MKQGYKYHFVKSFTNLIFFAVTLLISSNSYAAVGDCVKGMVNVYDHACDSAETSSGQCTTRMESTPEAYWCCCNEDYSLSQCATLFDGIFGVRSSVTSNSAMFISRGFRDNVLEKNKLGREYIALYYKYTADVINLLKKHPELADKTAKIFVENLQLIIDLTEGKAVSLTKDKKQAVLSLLKNYSIAIEQEDDFQKVVKRIYNDLESGKSLTKFKIKVID